MNQLPPDILRLLSFNLSLNDISRMSRVSKHFHRVLWKSEQFWWQLVPLFLTQNPTRLTSLRNERDHSRDLFQNLIEDQDIYKQIKYATRKGYEIYIEEHFDYYSSTYQPEDLHDLIEVSILNGHTDIYQLYRKYDEGECFYLVLAVLSRNLEMVKCIFGYSKEKEKFPQHLQDAFIHALRCYTEKHYDILEYLLTTGASLTQPDYLDSTPMEVALLTSLDGVKFLVSKGIRPSSNVIETVLGYVSNDSLPLLKYLLDDLGCPMPESLENISYCNLHLIPYLVEERHASVAGTTGPLWTAICVGNLQMIDYVLNHGAVVSITALSTVHKRIRTHPKEAPFLKRILDTSMTRVD